MIARGACDHAVLAFLCREGVHLIKAAANLEAPGSLFVFKLEPQLRFTKIKTGRAATHARARDLVTQELTRSLNVRYFNGPEFFVTHDQVLPQN
jgi:hypothetical protein